MFSIAVLFVACLPWTGAVMIQTTDSKYCVAHGTLGSSLNFVPCNNTDPKQNRWFFSGKGTLGLTSMIKVEMICLPDKPSLCAATDAKGSSLILVRRNFVDPFQEFVRGGSGSGPLMKVVNQKLTHCVTTPKPKNPKTSAIPLTISNCDPKTFQKFVFLP